jgi:hypothetical protein
MVLLGSKPQQKVWIAEVPYFLKNVGWSILPLIGLTSTTSDFFTINWKLDPSMVRSTTFHVFKKMFKAPETSGAQKNAHQPQTTVVTNGTVFSLHNFFQKNVQNSSLRYCLVHHNAFLHEV